MTRCHNFEVEFLRNRVQIMDIGTGTATRPTANPPNTFGQQYIIEFIKHYHNEQFPIEPKGMNQLEVATD